MYECRNLNKLLQTKQNEKKQMVLGSKGAWEADWSQEKIISGGKVCLGVKYVKEQTVTSKFESNRSS